jgi:hypothetical protein
LLSYFEVLSASSADQERITALNAINAMLATGGRDFHDLVDVLMGRMKRA